MTNLFLDRFAFNKLSLFLGEFLRHKHSVVGASVMSSPRHDISNIFPNIRVFKDVEIATGNYPSPLQWHLTDADMLYLSQYESIFTSILLRQSLKQKYWKNHQVSQLFYGMCNFWTDTLSNLNVHAVVSYCIPHDPSSFSLYIVTKLLKIPCIYIDIAHIANKYRYFGCSFTHRNLLLYTSPTNISPADFDSLANYFESLRSSDYISSAPPFIRYLETSRFSLRNFLNLFAFRPRKILSLLISFFTPVYFYKYSPTRFSTHSSNRISLTWFFVRIKVFLRLLAKKIRYLNICQPDSRFLSLKYIYFPSPLEPEGSTIPTALHSRNVYIAIERLVASLPSDCFIVFKVNPYQFDHRICYSTFTEWHSLDYYSSLAKISDRVLFASPFTPTYWLIDHSIGLACINGTASIEALARGKNSLTFSQNWYDCMPGLTVAKNTSDVELSLAKMKNSATFPPPSPDHLALDWNIVFSYTSNLDSDFAFDLVPVITTGFVAALRKFYSLDSSKWAL